jgi:predicted AAA+ superfamily ATPase
VPPYFEHFGKRLVKSPKVYFADSGLAASLLGIRSEADLAASPFRGSLFEGLVASEIVKPRLHRGLDRGLYRFRDRQGLEVCFVVDQGNRHLLLIEAKATCTPMPDDGRSLTRLAASIGHSAVLRAAVVHADTSELAAPTPLCPGVRAVGWHVLHALLDEGA